MTLGLAQGLGGGGGMTLQARVEAGGDESDPVEDGGALMRRQTRGGLVSEAHEREKFGELGGAAHHLAPPTSSAFKRS